MRTKGWLPGANQVNVHRGVRAITLDTEDAGRAFGRRPDVPYDRLVLATGSAHNMPTLSGVVAHAEAHSTASSRSARCRTARTHGRRAPGCTGRGIGGGLIGVEAACGLEWRSAVREIRQPGPHLMERQLDAGGGVGAHRTLDARGVRTTSTRAAIAVLLDTRGAGCAACASRQLRAAVRVVVFSCGIRRQLPGRRRRARVGTD